MTLSVVIAEINALFTIPPNFTSAPYDFALHGNLIMGN
jgi:hypothetical protein